ncbi:MAG: hypothetical protein AAF191_01460 [Verrucomicrobiota bacterium]
MEYHLKVIDHQGQLRFEQSVADEGTLVLQPGDRLFILDDADQLASVTLEPDGSDLIIRFPDGQEVTLDQYFVTTGEEGLIYVNVSPESDASAVHEWWYANATDTAPDQLTMTSGTPSESSGEGLGGGGVGSQPDGSEFTLMRLSNLRYIEFDETFSSFNDELYDALAADETPAPLGFGGGSGEPEAGGGIPVPALRKSRPLLPTDLPSPMKMHLRRWKTLQ